MVLYSLLDISSIYISIFYLLCLYIMLTLYSCMFSKTWPYRCPFVDVWCQYNRIKQSWINCKTRSERRSYSSICRIRKRSMLLLFLPFIIIHLSQLFFFSTYYFMCLIFCRYSHSLGHELFERTLSNRIET